VKDDGVWPLEIAPRPIGGLCARALRFGPELISLEELLVRQAVGLIGSEVTREAIASGVMMIPVPENGILERVEGVEEASASENIASLEITARLHDKIVAWPEGSSYLGFIFARADEPEKVEQALREAHGKLKFVVRAELPVSNAATGKLPAARGN
jgi:hypothetical protein